MFGLHGGNLGAGGGQLGVYGGHPGAGGSMFGLGGGGNHGFGGYGFAGYGYYQNLLRAQRQAKYLSHLRKCSKDELSGFLLALFESAHRPGGESNPVLVQGETALTQAMVSRYGDFLEWVLDR